MTTFKNRSIPSSLSVLTLAVATLVHGGAFAAASQEDLKNTKLYGNVSIAEDSSSSWGPWSNFEPPAAGPASASVTPRRSVELYRPLAQPVVESIGLGCAGGSLCGFGAYTAYEEGGNVLAASTQSLGFSKQSLPFAVLLNGQVTTAGEGPVPQAIRLFTTPLSGGVSVLMPDSGVLSLSIDANDRMYGRYMRETGTEDHFEYYDVSGGLRNNPMAETIQVMGGYVEFGIDEYIQGSSSNMEGGGYRWRGQEGPAVLGFATPDADMAALRGSNATATYLGSVLGKGASPVRIDVQFGPGTWSGSWNGGKDGYVATYNPVNGEGVSLWGQVGFTAQGTINGVNLKSTSVGTLDKDASVSGFVQGAFFGPKAAAVGGVAEIIKTNPGATTTGPSAAAASVAPREGRPVGYTAGKHVSTFLAVDTKLLNDR